MADPVQPEQIDVEAVLAELPPQHQPEPIAPPNEAPDPPPQVQVSLTVVRFFYCQIWCTCIVSPLISLAS